MGIKYIVPGEKELALVMGLMPSLYSDIGEGLAGVIAEFIRDDRYFKLLAVEKESGAATGFMAGCCRLEVDFECRAGIIEEIVVSPAYQKLGIGKAMLAEFEKWCAARGAKGFLVPCGREGFYEKIGFEKFVVSRYWKEFPLQTDAQHDEKYHPGITIHTCANLERWKPALAELHESGFFCVIEYDDLAEMRRYKSLLGGGSGDYYVLDLKEASIKNAAHMLKMSPRMNGKIIVVNSVPPDSKPMDGLVFCALKDVVKTVLKIHKDKHEKGSSWDGKE